MGRSGNYPNPMKSVVFVEPTKAHLEHIAANMNPLDVQEVHASGGFTPIEALETSVEMSDECFVVLVDGEPHCAFGVCSVEEVPFVGIPWLLSTGKLDEWKTQFLRESRRRIAEWMKEYALLTQMCDARHVESHGWLVFLGFQVSEVIPDYGQDKLPFYRFIKTRV